IIDLSPYNDSKAAENIVQRRDVYEHYLGNENFFFLNYNHTNQLRDVEIHGGLDIIINGVLISFSMDVENVAHLLDHISRDRKELADGEYFYEKLKMTIASSEAMGGEGSLLSYVYCSHDITHLLDDEGSS